MYFEGLGKVEYIVDMQCGHHFRDHAYNLRQEHDVSKAACICLLISRIQRYHVNGDFLIKAEDMPRKETPISSYDCVKKKSVKKDAPSLMLISRGTEWRDEDGSEAT